MTSNDLSQPEVTDAECESPLDCEGLLGVCQVATCESQRCVIGTASDGTTCDDGNLCTENDACAAGVCAGTAKACAAVSQCHLAGTCEPGTGACSTPPKLDGSACDDGNLCTVTDTCRLGVCVGNGKPADGRDGGLALRAAPGSTVVLEALAGADRGSAVAAVFTRGTSVEVVRAADQEPESMASVLAPRQVSLIRTPLDGRDLDLRWTPLTTADASCPGGAEAVTIGNLGVLSDDTVVLSGVVTRPMTLASGRTRKLGESPTGFVHPGSYFLARMTESGDVIWTLEFLGAFGESDPEPYPRGLATHPDGGIVAAVPLWAGAQKELVGADGVVSAIATPPGAASTRLARIGLDGGLRDVAELTAAPGGVVTSALVLTAEGAIGAAGTVVDGILSIRDGLGAGSQLGTGLVEGRPEAWVVWLDSDGGLGWSQQLFLDPSHVTGSEDLVLVSLSGALDEQGRVWFGFISYGPLMVRSASGVAERISDTPWPSGQTLQSTLVAFDQETGAVVEGHVLGGDFHALLAIESFRGNTYLSGFWSGVYDHRNGFPGSTSVETPYVSRLGDWFVTTGNADPISSQAFLEMSELFLSPRLARAGPSLLSAFNFEKPVVVTGWTDNFVLSLDEGGSGVAFRKVNTAAALDCD